MSRVNRAELLQALQTVQPGLSPRDIVEQSSCFVFRDGEVMTYNDEVACRMSTSLLEDLTGAVQATPLLAILSKLVEDEVEVEAGEGELLVVGKKRRSGIRMEAEITLPIDSCEAPGDKWLKLHSEFTEAVSIVQECAGKDESQFALTCIHIHPKYLEACDNFQMTRYRLKTGVKESCLIRRDALKHIVSLDMTEFNETDTWIHFRNPGGLVLSCRRYLEQYVDLAAILQVEGEPATLPKGLGEAAEKAEIFSAENSDHNQVRIELREGKLRVKGVGASGWYTEVKRLAYSGQSLVFDIAPKLLIELTRRHNDCVISPNRLKVDGGKWVYVTCLGAVEEKKKESPAPEKKTSKKKVKAKDEEE